MRIALLSLLTLLWIAPAARAQHVRYLTPPAAGDPVELAIRHARDAAGVSPDDAASAAVTRLYSPRSGLTHVRLRQRIGGIEVRGAEIQVSIDREGRVLRRSGRFVPAPRSAAPGISARAAILRAADALSLPVDPAALRPLGPPQGPDRAQSFAGASASQDDIPARLRWFPTADGVRLAWELVLREPGGIHWWSLLVDAHDGRVLFRNDWVEHQTYQVLPLALESPDDGPRQVLPDPSSPIASPFGWHDDDGVPGVEFTDTRGNNVRAQEDDDGNNAGGFRPTGLAFEFPLDLQTQDPGDYQPAAITNLFYWTNVLHDILYAYGFDEASGNFQTNNYGRGGAGNDAVRADAQDSSVPGNANMATPVDGIPPRLQMGLWDDAQDARLDVLAPPSIAGTYTTGVGLFGPAPTPAGTTGTVVAALDPSDPNGTSTTDACSPLTNAGAVSGNIALVDRGTCLFVEKVKHCQDAGAGAVIVADNVPGALIDMSGTDPTIAIPSIFVTQSDGAAIRAELGSGVGATVRQPPLRDADLDNGIVIHEYTHGLTTRLTGMADDSDCLTSAQPDGMSEGWSDWVALALTAHGSDVPTDPRGIATYLLAEPGSGPGIRTFPYSTDLFVNPLVYSDIQFQGGVHGRGEVWAAMLWEVFWNLVAVRGFDPDLYDGTGGNTVALELVVEGLKLQGCNPSHPVARNAILAADQAIHKGRDQCHLWAAFAKRGLGASANEAISPNSLVVTDAFDLPPECASFCSDGVLQTGDGEQCDDGNLIFGDGCTADCLAETTLRFGGVAQGGQVRIDMNGVSVVVPTSAGQTNAQVAANVAAAILADPTLAGLGVQALVTLPGVVATSGLVTLFEIDDAGLSAPIPTLDRNGAGTLLVLLLLAAAAAYRRRAPSSFGY